MKVKIKGVLIELTEEQVAFLWSEKLKKDRSREVKKRDHSPIAKVSEKRKKVDREYSKLKAQKLKANPECEAQLEGCLGVADQVHHKAGKSSKEQYLKIEDFLSTCGICHRWIEDHPKEAKALGLSASRLNKRA